MARHRAPESSGSSTSRFTHSPSTRATAESVAAESVAAVPHGHRGAHRRPSHHSGTRVIVVSVAVGAMIAAGSSATSAASPLHGVLETDNPADHAPPAMPVIPEILAAPELRPAIDLLDQLRRGLDREQQRLADEAAARAVRTAVPVSGTLTSSYGARWGQTHYGLDIANSIGTPVVSVTAGEVIESGPASGFGLWIRVLQDDGTIGVYGHINETLVTAGQRVQAGEQIATVGNRGQSTGPHLHYEVWQQDGAKLDPRTWLSARGVNVT